jgi:hypothetical protein
MTVSATAPTLTGTTHYVDPNGEIELELPAAWQREPREELLLELRAPDDPWTVLQLSRHSLDGTRSGELIDAIVAMDSRRWSMERRASLVHNSAAAVETDFALHLNGAAWIMRKLFLPAQQSLYALAFMTRFATWSRYSAAHRSVHRSFSLLSHRRPRQSFAPRSDLAPPERAAAPSGSETRALLL